MNEEQNTNQLPKDWKSVKLGDIAEITSSRRIFQEEYVNEGIPFFRTKEIKELNEGREISVELFITNQKYNEIKSKNEIPKIGDILLSAVGTIGVSYIIKDDKPFYFKDGNLIWIRKLNGVVSKYLHFNFAHFIRFKQQITTSGSAYNALTIIKLKGFKIPLPPKSTQEAIVSKIEELFSELDKGIEILHTAQQQLKTYRQSVLKWAFEGKLTNESVKEGALPKEWKTTKLGNYIENISSGKSYRCDERPPKQDEVGIVKVSSVTWGTFDEMESKTCFSKEFLNEKYLIKEGDFLFSRANTIELIGACVLVKKIDKRLMLSDKILRFTFSKDVSKVYSLYYLRSRKGRKQIETLSTGNQDSMRNIGQEKIRQIEFPYCLIKEQNKIIQEIESRLSVADKMEDSITQSLQQAEALRQSILKKAFEGKLI